MAACIGEQAGGGGCITQIICFLKTSFVGVPKVCLVVALQLSMPEVHVDKIQRQGGAYSTHGMRLG
jgi:hypothetical protein